MKKYSHSIVTGLLAVFTFLFVIKSVGIARDITMLKLQASAKQATEEKLSPEKSTTNTTLTAYELVTARQAVQGVVWHYKLPLVVELQKTELSITTPKKLAGEEKANPIEAVLGKDDAKDLSVLEDFDGIMGLLSAMASLPYQVNVKDLCIGKECSGGFTMMVEMNK